MARRRSLSTAIAGTLALLATSFGTASVATAADDSGSSVVWTPTYTAGVSMPNVPSLNAFRDGSVFAVIDGYRVTRSRDGGKTWTAEALEQPTNGGGFQMPLSMATPDVGYAASATFLSRTRDGAQTWQNVRVPFVTTVQFESIAALATADRGNTVVVAKTGSEFIDDNCPDMLRYTPVQVSRDAGRTWRRSDLGFPSQPRSLEMHDRLRGTLTVFPTKYEAPVKAEDGSCSGGGGERLTRIRVMRTVDGGRSWQRSFACSTPCSATWVNDKRLVVAETNGAVYVSGDRGTSYRRLGTVFTAADGEKKYLHDIDFAGSKIGYAAVYGSGTYRTTDGGRTWRLERMEPGEVGVGLFNVNGVAAFGPEGAVAASTTALSTRQTLP